MPFAETAEGLKIYYESHGDGPPLLLISGTGHDHKFWAGQIPLLSSKYRCFIFDNRGVGQSAIPSPGYTLADMADDAAAVLDAAEIERSHVMGFSMGGHIAQEFALNHGERVISLGLHHTWARPSARLTSFQEIRKRLAEADDRQSLIDVSLLALHAPDYARDHADEMQAKRAWMLENMETLEGWIGQLDACIGGDTLERISAISVPTLVTCSDQDMIVPPHLAQEIHGQITGSRLEILKGTGHVALIERPDEFAQLCFDFLGGLGG